MPEPSRRGRPFPAVTSAAVVVVLSVGLSLSGCAATRYDASIPSEPPPATTTTLPTGTAATLLPRLVSASGQLSRAITATGGDKAAVAEQIASLWQAAKQEVGRTRPELLGDFDASVALSARAARFNRAADADKAYNNLRSLVAAYLA